MAASPSLDRCLTEEDVRTASQQYDVMLIYHASLPRLEFTHIEPTTFTRCAALQLLDLSGNKLTTLVGLEPVAAQLTFLNVAENRLRDISALAACTALQRCHLEGNELATVADLAVLVSLPQLSDLVLQRPVPLADANPAEMLLLDNPVCRSVEAYRDGFLRKTSHIRWVDGVTSFVRCGSLAASGKDRDDTTDGAASSNAGLMRAAAASHEATLKTLVQSCAEEKALDRLLADAAKRCEKARTV